MIDTVHNNNMPKLHQPVVSIGNDTGVCCAICEQPTRWFHITYGTLNTGQFGFTTVERRNGERVPVKYPICVTGYFCVQCTKLGQSFKLQEPR